MWRAIILVVAGFASLVLVKVGPALLGFVGGKLGVEAILSSPHSQLDFEAQSRNAGYLTFTAIREELPHEWPTLKAEVDNLINNAANEEEIFKKAMALTVDIRRRNASRILEAPDGNIYHLLATQLELLEAVRLREPATKCSEFAVLGPGALGTKPAASYLRAFDNAAVALMRTIGAAIRAGHGVRSSPTTEEDWAIAAEAMLHSGSTNEDLEVAASADPSDERLCPSIVKFYKAILALEGDAGKRIRAELAFNLGMG